MQEDLKNEPLPLKVIQMLVKNRLREGSIYRISQRYKRGNKWKVQRKILRCIKRYDQYALFEDKNGHRESLLYQDLYRQEAGGRN